jgi:hypothetical protein
VKKLKILKHEDIFPTVRVEHGTGRWKYFEKATIEYKFLENKLPGVKIYWRVRGEMESVEDQLNNLLLTTVNTIETKN